MITQEFRNKSEYLEFLNSQSNEEMKVEKLIAEKNTNTEQWYHIGYCEVCQEAKTFLLDWNYSNGILPNYRERLVCEKCKLNNRQRFMWTMLNKLVIDSKEQQTIYCYEQVTRFYKTIRESFANHQIIGSEYLGYDLAPGAEIKGIRHEDALDLSFDDASLDVIVSNDVYEHVPDIYKSISEAYRVLRNGGRMLISVPFHSREDLTIKRAELINGDINFLLKPQYHGNPISADGSLVFYDYGWDFLEFFLNAGFRDAYVVGYNSYLHGYMGGLQLMFMAQK